MDDELQFKTGIRICEARDSIRIVCLYFPGERVGGLEEKAPGPNTYVEKGLAGVLSQFKREKGEGHRVELCMQVTRLVHLHPSSTAIF